MNPPTATSGHASIRASEHYSPLGRVSFSAPLATEAELGELTDDALTGDFRILQRKRGHRYSLDDVLTADVATRVAPEAGRILDLGCGIGSVLLMLAWRRPSASLVGVEAQTLSIELARRNVLLNGLGDRVKLWLGDLRGICADDICTDDERFDLVSGTPPYAPVGTASPSPDSQRTHARIEMRGGVEDYLLAASRKVAEAGRVVVCVPAQAGGRVREGASKAGLVPLSYRDACPREGRPALFTVWTLAPAVASDPTGPATRLEDFVARDREGRRTAAYLELRRAFGLGTEATLNRADAEPKGASVESSPSP